MIETFPILQSTLPNYVCPEIHTTCEPMNCQFLELAPSHCQILKLF